MEQIYAATQTKIERIKDDCPFITIRDRTLKNSERINIVLKEAVQIRPAIKFGKIFQRGLKNHTS